MDSTRCVRPPSISLLEDSPVAALPADLRNSSIELYGGGDGPTRPAATCAPLRRLPRPTARRHIRTAASAGLPGPERRAQSADAPSVQRRRPGTRPRARFRARAVEPRRTSPWKQPLARALEFVLSRRRIGAPPHCRGCPPSTQSPRRRSRVPTRSRSSPRKRHSPCEVRAIARPQRDRSANSSTEPASLSQLGATQSGVVLSGAMPGRGCNLGQSGRGFVIVGRGVRESIAWEACSFS